MSALSSTAFASAAGGRSVLVSETGVERLQLVGRVGTSTFLMGGSREDGQMQSGPNPYDLLSASLAACTVMTLRLYAERKKLPLGNIRVSVSHRRGSIQTRDHFERIVMVDGDLNQQQRDRLLQIADLCPVGKTLSQGADIQTVFSPPAEQATVSSATVDYIKDVQELPIPNVDW